MSFQGSGGPTQVLDEITIKEITSMQKPTIASFYDNASPLLGNPNASITLVEFGDYQCTFCKKFFHETGESILTNYIKTGKVKMLFKDWHPLPLTPKTPMWIPGLSF